MKRIITTIFVAIIGLGFILTGIGIAQNPNFSGKNGWGNAPYQRGMGPGKYRNGRGMMRGQFQQRQGMMPGYWNQGLGLRGPIEGQREAQIELLAEMSGQSVESLQNELKTQPFPALLTKYQIKHDEFAVKLHAKLTILIDKAVEAGKLTPEQAQARRLRMDQMSRQQTNAWQPGMMRGKRWAQQGIYR